MLENEIREAEGDVRDADARLEEALEKSHLRDRAEGLQAAAINQAGARIALALLRGAQALAQNMGDPRR